MQKNINVNQKVILLLLVLFVYLDTMAQHVNQVTISVKSIEYDDPGFVQLKENFQKNKKVSAFKQSFDDGMGKITFSSTSTAQDLWNEVPKATKDLFKVNTIDDNRIVLDSKNATSQDTKAKQTTTSKNTAADCNCYWDICHYDVLKTFGGVVYMGINRDDGTYYYNCDNGILIQKLMIVNSYGVVIRTNTDTLLISNPVGTTWGAFKYDASNEFLSVMSGVDFSSAGNGAYKLIANNISTTVGGKTYKNVIVVNSRRYTKDAFFGTSYYSTNSYYAKAVGLIRTDTLNFDSDPIAAINKQNDTKTVYSGGSIVKNGIDESIIGTWKFHNASTNKDGFYKFNGDGSFDYYEGSVSEANKYKGPNYWKIEEGGYNKNGVAILDLTWSTGKGFVLRNELQKKNDPVTKKPAILLQGAMLVSADNKAPW
jgi:hypothetical protein